MMSSGIYIIEFIGGSFYIGSATNIKRRILNHLSRLRRGVSNCVALQRAFTKYGETNFTYRVLEYCSIESLRSREMYYIINMGALDVGYNIAKDTSIPMLGRKHTQHTKHIMSAKSKGNRGRSGHKLSTEHKEKIRVALQGKLVGIPINVGESNAAAKLSTEAVKRVRELKGVISQRDIGKLFNISQQQVSKIHTNKRWKINE